jgi:uncharacterized protein
MNRQPLLLPGFTFLFCIGLLHISDGNSVTARESTVILSQQVETESVESERIESDRIEPEPIEAVRRLIQAIEEKDIDTINQLIADDIVLEQPYSQEQPGGVRVEGRAIANTFFERIFSEFSQIRFVDVVYRQSQFDNAVIVEARGDFRVASNQAAYQNRYIAVFEVVEGQIVMLREYFNPLIESEI